MFFSWCNKKKSLLCTVIGTQYSTKSFFFGLFICVLSSFCFLFNLFLLIFFLKPNIYFSVFGLYWYFIYVKSIPKLDLFLIFSFICKRLSSEMFFSFFYKSLYLKKNRYFFTVFQEFLNIKFKANVVTRYKIFCIEMKINLIKKIRNSFPAFIERECLVFVPALIGQDDF